MFKINKTLERVCNMNYDENKLKQLEKINKENKDIINNKKINRKRKRKNKR